MTERLWNDVDEYFNGLLVPPDPALEAALAAGDAAGLPPINVAPNQGKLLHLMARMRGAKRILEIGTLAGYSTIWLGRALPLDGRMVSLELDPRHAEVARASLARAGLSDRVEVRVGPALDSLPGLAGEEPFDFVFIDADKANNAAYFGWALKLTRKGAVIIIDNVVRNGQVADPETDNIAAIGVRRVMTMMAEEPRVTATAVQTVGSKGYDGFAIALVTADA